MSSPLRKIMRLPHERMAFEFTVDSWDQLRGVSDCIESPIFEPSFGQAWCLEIMPKGLPTIGSATNGSHGDSSDSLTTGTVTVALKNCSPTAQHFSGTLSVVTHDDSLATCQEFPNVCLVQNRELKSGAEEILFLPPGISLNENCTRVVFSCSLMVFGSPECFSGKPFSQSSALATQRTLNSDLKAFFTLTQMARGMPEHRALVDIVLTTTDGSGEIHCHQAILAARSSVLRKKFSKPGFGARMFFSNGRYSLKDISSSVLEALVLYMYTDEVSESMLILHGRDLLQAGIKYRVHSLVACAEQFLADTLMPDCAAELLLLASSIGAENLAQAASDFCAAHLADVMSNDECYSKLNAEMLRSILQQQVVPMGLPFNLPMGDSLKLSPLRRRNGNGNGNGFGGALCVPSCDDVDPEESKDSLASPSDN